MGKAGEKQKRRPKLSDKQQSERFKKMAKEVGADEDGEAFERVIEKLLQSGAPKYITIDTASIMFAAWSNQSIRHSHPI